MSYLWTDYSKKNFYVSDEMPPEPFSEVSNNPAKINFLLRFGEIFLPLMDCENVDQRREIENIFYHFLAQIDFICGKFKFYFEDEIICHELENNFYGDRCGEIFRQLDKKTQKKIAKILRKQEKIDSRELFYFDAVKIIFPDAKLYFYADEQKIFIYLPQEENDCDKLTLEILQILFLDISCLSPEIFWKKHFGIIGKNKTMLLDEISLY